jgi:putative FmdB family regulatory protein
MPIYAYKCSSCGHEKDVLQKVSDAPLTVCPACGAEAFGKQVTAAGFQLKGSGWYATDFRNPNKPATATGETNADAKGDAKADAKADTKAETKADAAGGKSGGSAESGKTAAPAPVPSPAPTPAPAAGGAARS